VILWAALVLCRVIAAPVLPALPTIPVNTLDAAAFGAKADSSTDNAVALQKAVDSLAAAGGGSLRIPAAKKPYLTGPIVLKNSTALQLDSGAILQMLPYGRYPMQGDSSYLAMISANSVHDIAITGAGAIEGNGSAWWDAYKASKISRPAMISVTRAQRILLSDFRIRNAPNVHTTFHYAVTDMTMRRVNIWAPSTSPNTDGCDFEGLRALFDHDTIQVGDDNIAIQPGHDSTAEITIQDCFLGVGHGLSIGSWCGKGLRNLSAQRVVFKGTTSGIRMKAGRDRGGMVRDLLYKDITMTDVQYPLYITSYYPSSPATTAADTAAPLTATTPYWKNITVQNLTSTSSLSGYNSVVIYALPEMAVDSLTLIDAHFTAPNALSIQHSHDMFFSGVTYNGSSTTLFGTSRDVTYRKTSGVSIPFGAPHVGMADWVVRDGRNLTNRSSQPLWIRVRDLDGAAREEGFQLAPGARRVFERSSRWREVEVNSASGRIGVSTLAPW